MDQVKHSAVPSSPVTIPSAGAEVTLCFSRSVQKLCGRGSGKYPSPAPCLLVNLIPTKKIKPSLQLLFAFSAVTQCKGIAGSISTPLGFPLLLLQR